MKLKRFIIFILLIGLLLNFKLVLADEQDFKSVGNVVFNDKEVPLSVKEGVAFVEYGTHYEISAKEVTFIKIGDSDIKIPSNSKLLISKDLSKNLISGASSLGNILLELSSDSEGEIGLPDKEPFDLSVSFSNKDVVSLKGIKQKFIKVKEGAIEIEPGNKISYTNYYSATMQIESVSNLNVGNNGFDGIFKVINNEDLSVGEIEGSGVIPLLSSKNNKITGKNVVRFYGNFRNKYLFGSLKYTDFAYDYTVSTENAEVNIPLNVINFISGDGSVTRYFKNGNLNLNQKFVIENGKVLVQPFFDSEIKGEVARSDIIISGKESLIAVDKFGKIRDLNSENSGFDIFNYWDLSFLVDKDEETKALYNSYLLSGFKSTEAVLLADAKIEVKDGAPFLKKELLRLLGSNGVKELIRRIVSADLVESYLDEGVADYFQILSLIDNEVSPFNVRQYTPLLKRDFGEVARLNVPPESVGEYKNILKDYISDSYLESGDIYAKLHYYGVLPSELNGYGKVFSKLKREINDENLVHMVRLLSPTEIGDYLKAGINEPDLMIQAFEYGINPKDVSKYKFKGKYYFYPGVIPEDVKSYTMSMGDGLGVYGDDIALLKLLEIQHKEAKKFLDNTDLLVSRSKTKKKEIMKSLGLTEDRYDLPFLDLVYKNWQSDKAYKPIALIILNRADPVVERIEGIELSAFRRKYDNYLPLFKNYHVLLFEASTDNEMDQRVKEVYKKFGAIDRVIIGAHGNPDVLGLGDGDDEENLIDKSDFDLFRTIKTTTKDNSAIFLDSCSTGKGVNPISESIGKSVGIRVFAPTCNINTYKFVLNRNGELIGIEYKKPRGQ